MSTQREKEDAYLSCKGDVCAGWLAGRLLAWESGEWILVRVESSDSRKRQKPRLEKPKRDFSIRRAFALSSHTHTSNPSNSSLSSEYDIDISVSTC
jgi:hypothetical protein